MPDEPQQVEQEQEPVTQEQNGGGEKSPIAEMPPQDQIKSEVAEARAQVPAIRGIISPENWQHWVTVGQSMAKAYLMLPPHLHNNVPVCVAVCEVSSRYGFSPYMVGSMTYVQKNRLCYESKLYVAFLYASDELIGSLHLEWMGEGEAMTCSVSGRLQRDPGELKVLKSLPLGHLHPGHTEKDGKRYVVGSPLWDRKPHIQLAYDTQRDWARLYAPGAVLGLYTPDEMIESDRYAIREEAPGLRQRLTVDRVPSTEGFSPEHISTELAKTAPSAGIDSLEPPAERKGTRARRKPQIKAKAPTRTPPSPKPAKARPEPRQRPKKAPTKEEVKIVADRAKKPPEKAKTKPLPWFEYVTKTEAWIGELKSVDAGEKRWTKERDERDKLMVPIPERTRLRKLLDAKQETLRETIDESRL